MSNDSRGGLRERGLAIRGEVLGDKYVDAVLNKVTDFNRPASPRMTQGTPGDRR